MQDLWKPQLEGNLDSVGNQNPKVLILATIERQGTKFRWIWIGQFQRYLKILNAHHEQVQIFFNWKVAMVCISGWATVFHSTCCTSNSYIAAWKVQLSWAHGDLRASSMRPMEYLWDLETWKVAKAMLTEALKQSGKPWEKNKEDVILTIKLGYSMQGKQRWRS